MSDEIVSLVNPAVGQYLIKVLGYTVMGDPGLFTLTIMYGVIGTSLADNFDDGTIGSGTYEFDVEYGLPAVPGVYVGTVMFGLDGAGDIFKIDVTFTVQA